MHSALSVFFRWLLRQRRVASNPCVGVWRPSAPPARDRVLDDREIVWLWRATEQLAPRRSARSLGLLLTGCRLSEVAGMRRDELTEDAAWVIPAERAKNHRKHVLHLAPLAREAVASAPPVEGPFVFTTTGRSPISGWSKAKSVLDAAMLQVAREEAEAEGRDLGRVLAPFRLHDLRRTAASGMQRLGTRVEVVELCLNHVSGSYAGITGTYQRDPMLDERRVAMQRWSAHVAGLVSGKAANVVPMPRKRKGARWHGLRRRYMARGLKTTRRRSPRVEEHWGLLVQMQKLIEDANLSPNKAAVMVAKDHWRSVSKTEDACLQWLKDNQRKFRGELRPSTLRERLEELQRVARPGEPELARGAAGAATAGFYIRRGKPS